MPAAHSCLIMTNRAFFLLALLGVFSVANAGVMVGGKRFVFYESNKVLSVAVRNPDAQNYLIKARVLPPYLWIKDGTLNSAGDSFIITPPLFRLDAEKENTIRIVRGTNPLPNDRESLFEFSVAAIPSVKGQPNSVSLAIRSRFKLFYRPDGLSGDVKMAWSSLRWHQQGNMLIATNPTPWFITLSSVVVNGTAANDPGMIQPFGQQEYVGCKNTPSCSVRWRALNDYGQPTDFMTATATSEPMRSQNQ